MFFLRVVACLCDVLRAGAKRKNIGEPTKPVALPGSDVVVDDSLVHVEDLSLMCCW